ncbi:STAS domain-containing protein [Streptomyces sp. NPDC100445]|uniref:STAS domain-containing protein n=1 Tax=Streptomyces sp. NPDC100445 TaxID=3366102 RepID=UPI0037FE13CA
MCLDEVVAVSKGGRGEQSPGSDGGVRAEQRVAVAQYAWRGVWTVVAHGPCDEQTVTPLAHALDTAAKNHATVVLDASGITFADSALLNLLILTHRATDLRVVAPGPQLRRLLEITGVDTVLRIRATVDDAVSAE